LLHTIADPVVACGDTPATGFDASGVVSPPIFFHNL
jgi:hypothetical protein